MTLLDKVPGELKLYIGGFVRRRFASHEPYRQF